MTVILPNSDMFMNNQFLLIILLIVLLQLRERKVKTWSLIFFPAFMLFISLSLISNQLFLNYYSFILIIVGFLAGIIIGILIGRFMEVKVDDDGAMLLKGTYIAVFLWIFVILIKIYGENLLNHGMVAVDILTSIFIMMTLGAMISRRIVIYRKYLKHREIKNNS